MKMLFVHAPEETQVIAQAGPRAFHRVAMDFAHPITVIVPSPFPLAWLVTNLLEYSSLLWQMVIGLPFIRVHGTALRSMSFHKWLKRWAVAVVAYLQTNLAAFSANYSGYRRAVIIPGTMPFDFIGTPPRWIIRVTMFSALFTRILVHFIGFGDNVGQG
jgi:hypothetical protein